MLYHRKQNTIKGTPWPAEALRDNTVTAQVLVTRLFVPCWLCSGSMKQPYLQQKQGPIEGAVKMLRVKYYQKSTLFNPTTLPSCTQLLHKVGPFLRHSQQVLSMASSFPGDSTYTGGVGASLEKHSVNRPTTWCLLLTTFGKSAVTPKLDIAAITPQASRLRIIVLGNRWLLRTRWQHLKDCCVFDPGVSNPAERLQKTFSHSFFMLKRYSKYVSREILEYGTICITAPLVSLNVRCGTQATGTFDAGGPVR